MIRMLAYPRPRRRWGFALPALGVMALAGCEPPRDAGCPLHVEYSGCRTVLEGPVCVPRTSASLHLWVAAPPPAAVRITAGGRRLESRGIPVQAGQRFELAIPAGAGEIEVRTAGACAASWQLAIDRRPQPEWWRRMRELFRSGRPDDRAAAIALLEEMSAAPSPADRGEALALLGNLRLQQGDHAAVELLSRSVDAFRAAGRVRDEVRNAGTLVFVLLAERRFEEARSVLDALRPAADAPAEASAWIAYYRGLLAEQTGDSRSALRHLAEAAARAERVAHHELQRDGEQLLARHLQSLGRSREALEIFARWGDAEAPGSCRQARWWTNHAWTLLLALEAGDAPAEDPTVSLGQALDVYTDPAANCTLQDDRRDNVLVNLALAHLHAGRPRRARQALAAAGAALPRGLWRPAGGRIEFARAAALTRRERHREPLLQRLWRLEVEARIQFAKDDREGALERYERLGELAAGASLPEARWRAEVGRGRVLAASGERKAALAALARAEGLLDEESLHVPIHEGRETFVAQREAGTRLYLGTLLADGRVAEAFAAARRARARVLRGLRRGDRLAQLEPGEQARWDRALFEYSTLRDALLAGAEDDWWLPAEELDRRRGERRGGHARLRGILDRAFAVLDAGRDLGKAARAAPSRPPGEVTLLYHPLDDGWVGFAAHGEGVTALRIADPAPHAADPAELARGLLAPFAEILAASPRLRILPYGPLRAVDFHALPFGGDVLLAGRTVTYGLDLGEAPAPALAGRPAALVIGDPREDLPAARAEAEAVGRALAAVPGWDVRLLTGGRAGAGSVRRLLPAVELLHYAGHGAFAGRGGWESALALAGGSRLTLGDVLTLERAPRWVVLSSCEAARSAFEAPAESVAMAHAFLAAGSRQVIAAVRPVDDRETAELVAELYRRWDGSADLATLLRAAQLARRAAAPGSDWASFRALER